MGDSEKKYVLSSPVKYTIRDKTYTVYPLSFAQLDKVAGKIDELGRLKDASLKKQIVLAVDIVYDILKDCNTGLTKEIVKNTFTMEAFAKIIPEAIGDVGAAAIANLKDVA